MIIDPAISLTAKCLIAGLFLHSGIYKLRDVGAFMDVLSNYGVGKILIFPAAILIVGAELLIAAMVMASFITPIWFAVPAGLLLLGFYTVLLTSYYLNGRRIDCGCNFGSKAETISLWHVIRNASLLIVGVLYLLPMSDRPIIWMDYFSALVCAVMIGLFLVIIETMRSNNNHFVKIKGSA